MIYTDVNWTASGSPANDTVVAFAGKQLAQYIAKLTGVKPSVHKTSKVKKGNNTIWLSTCDHMPPAPEQPLSVTKWDDGFAIWAQDSNLFISGRNPRSVLFGVYAFLEHQGICFLRPGKDGELIPQISDLKIVKEPIIEDAQYRHRGVCIEGATSLEHALGMVDWCAKKRMNTVFLQFLSSQYFLNNWYERKYNPQFAGKSVSTEEALAMDDQIIDSMRQRGLVFHRVGHGWTSAAVDMPRSGWVKADEAVKPEFERYLAEVKGKRELYQNIPINTELCYSYKPAFDRFIANIVHYCEQHPEMDVVHVWLSDAVNNKCECPECTKLSISDWYAKVINALSEALHEKVPQMRFVFLAYIELLWAPENIVIDERYGNAILMFAPISRCYGHSFADKDCDDGQEWPRPVINKFDVSKRNAFFNRSLEQWRNVFHGDGFDFDYHLMWANWLQLTDTRIARIFHDDLTQLKNKGLDGILSCQSFRNFYPSGLAMNVMAESLWNPNVSWEEQIDGYYQAAYGKNSDFAADYFKKLEAFLDTGDSHWRTPPFSNANRRKLREATSFLRQSLATAIQLRANTEIKTQRLSLDLLILHTRFLQLIVRSYQARLSGKTEVADQYLDRAAAYLKRHEPRYSTYMDTMLALEVSVGAHRQNKPINIP